MKMFVLKLLVFMLCLISTGCEKNLYISSNSEPTITEAQFNCKLIYELDGEIVELEDTILCSYSGYRVVGEAGNKREWELTLKSGNKDMTLLDFKGKNVTDALGRKMLKLYFYCGTAEYYMGEDENQGARSAQDFNLISYKYVMENGEIGDSVITAEEAYKKYKIKLIAWKCDKPIKNQFE